MHRLHRVEHKRTRAGRRENARYLLGDVQALADAGDYHEPFVAQNAKDEVDRRAERRPKGVPGATEAFDLAIEDLPGPGQEFIV